jgi:hypothetical protein
MQSPVVTDMDLLMRSVIIGCPQIGPGIKPCTKIISILSGRSVDIRVDAEIPILKSLMALTDGMPPGQVSAITDGESNAEPAPYSAQATTLANAAESGAAFCRPCKMDDLRRMNEPQPATALKALHPDSSLSPAKLAAMNKATTDALIASLAPGQRDCLKTRPDGTMRDGHHRISVLRKRGVDVDKLPREIEPKAEDGKA